MINLKDKNIKFEHNGYLCKIITYDKVKMVAQIECYKNEKLERNDKIVFAHLPKNIKKTLNPL